MSLDNTNIPGPLGEPTPEGGLQVLISSYRRGSDDVEAAGRSVDRSTNDEPRPAADVRTTVSARGHRLNPTSCGFRRSPTRS